MRIEPENNFNLVDNTLLKALKSEMAADEDLLWHASPAATLKYCTNLVLVSFGLIWSLFTVTAYYQFISAAMQKDQIIAQIVFTLFFVPFFLVGLVFLLSPFRSIKVAKRTIYAVTNKRAIILKLGKRKRLKSILPNQMVEVVRTEDNENIGHLFFYEKSFKSEDGTVRQVPKGFLSIKNPRQAERFINELKG